MSEALKKTPLWNLHKELGARLVPFAGYDMPVQYTGLIDEHQSVRNNCGLFDVAHMGLLKIEGAGAHDFLNRSVTRDLSKLQPGRAAYSLLCFPSGGTVDDLIIYREGEELFYAVLNASNKEKDLAYLRELAQGEKQVRMTPLFDEMSLLALQGPKAPQILSALGLSEWKEPFSFIQAKLGDIPVKIAFTGYTGEKGCEIFVENNQAPALWTALMKAGAPHGLKPCGLGARDTLRTEMGYSLYGHELSDDINPIEAGLSWAVGLKKSVDFVGKKALEAAKAQPRRKLVSLMKKDSKQAPRNAMRVFDQDGQDVGFVTSGTFAPSLGYAIGLALVDASALGPFNVDIRGSKVAFETTTRPFYKHEQGA